VAAPAEIGCNGCERQGIRTSAAGHEHPRGVPGSGEGVLQLFPCFADDWRQSSGPASSFAC